MSSIENMKLSLNYLFQAGDVVEARIITDVGVDSGYFDDFDALVQAVYKYNKINNIYIALNPVNRELLARSYNKIIEGARQTTSSRDIACLRWLLIDIDPVRTNNTSSTDQEVKNAMDLLCQVIEFLGLYNITVIPVCSGNGMHGLIRLPDYPNDDRHANIVKALIHALSDKFSNDVAIIDKSVCKPGQLTKLYGSCAVKGVSTPERPHRQSFMVSPETPVHPVDLIPIADSIIAACNGPAYQHQLNCATEFQSEHGIDIPAMLNRLGLEFHIKKDSDRIWYNLKRCPVHDDHDNHQYECGICLYSNGKLGAKCQHDDSKGWQDFKLALSKLPSKEGYDPEPHRSGVLLQANVTDNLYKNLGDELDTILDPVEKPLTTGFSAFDRLGGLHKGINVFTAPPGLGKSAWIQVVAEKIAEHYQYPLLFVEAEMPIRSIIARGLARVGGIDSRDVNHSNVDSAKLIEAINKYRPICNFINYMSAPLTLERIERALLATNAKVLFIDSLQSMSTKSEYINRRSEIDSCLRGIVSLQAKYDLYVVLVSEMSRSQHHSEQYAKGRGMGALKESGTIEYLATMVWILERADNNTESSDNDPTVETINYRLVKNRYGPTGVVKMHFCKRYNDFKEA